MRNDWKFGESPAVAISEVSRGGGDAVAAAGAYVQQQTGKAPSGSPTAVANVKFYQEHLAEIEPINARLRKLSVLGAGEDEGDEPTDKPDDD